MASPADYLTTLADLVARTGRATLPASTVAAARAVVLDTIGAMLAGSQLPENSRLARLMSERSPGGPATLIGHDAATEPMFAALVNATSGVGFEVDEGNRWGGGHPAIHVLPAVLAVAEERGTSGRALIQALVAGYEVTSRIGGAAQLRPNVHSHGTWGTPGAAAGVATLLGRGSIRAIISLAASMSPANSWTPCFESATIRNAYPGRSAMQGILAVHLHDCGYTGLADGPSDVYGTLLAERFDPDRVVEGIGPDGRVERYRIEQNYFKLHACCLYNHPTLDALDALQAAAPFRAEEVERVEATSIPFTARMAGWYPSGMLSAKFSIPYAVAARLVSGRSDPAAFLEPVIADERVRALAARVTVATDPAMSMQRSDPPQARVRVVLRDGRVLERATTVVRGDAANPAPPEALLAKFHALAAPVVGAAGADRIARAVEGLDALADVRALTAVLGAGARALMASRR
ncbi:MAG TPA: MmgE/PrpD family protein [Candidatus Binatia bacterium]|nr:MmgE/PrpD family protein [Candidatus Binatia bacterium]